jgi:hypothetical protein
VYIELDLIFKLGPKILEFEKVVSKSKSAGIEKLIKNWT